MVITKKTKTDKCLLECRGKADSYDVGRKVNSSSHCGIQYRGASKTVTHKYHMIQPYHSWVYT
jgi:hypothetical protein